MFPNMHKMYFDHIHPFCYSFLFFPSQSPPFLNFHEEILSGFSMTFSYVYTMYFDHILPLLTLSFLPPTSY
jgi:hypothetical protein